MFVYVRFKVFLFVPLHESQIPKVLTAFDSFKMSEFPLIKRINPNHLTEIEFPSIIISSVKKKHTFNIKNKRVDVNSKQQAVIAPVIPKALHIIHRWYSIHNTKWVEHSGLRYIKTNVEKSAREIL